MWGFRWLSFKESACNAVDAGNAVSILGLGRSLGGGNGNSVGILDRKIPWTVEPGRLQFLGSQRFRHD